MNFSIPKSLLAGMTLLVLFSALGVATFAQDATEVPEPASGDVRVDEFGIEQVWVPAGCFMMGTSADEADYALSLDPPAWAQTSLPTEQPQYEVCLSDGYWIDRTEVTNAAFQAFVDAGGYTTPELWSEAGLEWLDSRNLALLPTACDDADQDIPENPRVCITWYEAEAYANWRGGQLPTEAQWEYAARGPESFIYPWGNEWDASLANIVNSIGVVPVGSFPDGASWVGALDMAGNAMEWVSNWFDPNYYDLGISEDPQGPESGTRKLEKGGWWGSNAFVARSAYHLYEDPPRYQAYHIGVRIITMPQS